MNEWNVFSSTQKKILVTDNTSKKIVETLGSALSTFFGFEKSIRPERTRLIKDQLTLLGHKRFKDKPKYKVYGNKISDELRQENGGIFKNREWLFDLHWYTEGEEPFTPISLPLVVECEWNPKWRWDTRKVPYSGFKYDFQKLLVTNAELRLMIFIIKAENDLKLLGNYFEKTINEYVHLEINSKFLFVAYDEKIKGFHYREIFKSTSKNSR